MFLKERSYWMDSLYSVFFPLSEISDVAFWFLLMTTLLLKGPLNGLFSCLAFSQLEERDEERDDGDRALF